jgi:hypothetical protein
MYWSLFRKTTANKNLKATLRVGAEFKHSDFAILHRSPSTCALTAGHFRLALEQQKE